MNDNMRAAMLYEFDLGRTSTEAMRNLEKVFGEEAPSLSRVKRWFKKFRTGDGSIKDALRSGRPSKVLENELLEYLQSHPNSTTEHLAQHFCLDTYNIRRHLKKLGFSPKLDQWVPSILSGADRLTRLKIAKDLLLGNETEPFLDRIVTGDDLLRTSSQRPNYQRSEIL